MRFFKTILVTGGAGFIGANLIRYLLGDSSGFSGKIVNLDKLTYAGNLDNLLDIQEKYGDTRYFFEQGDICDRAFVEKLFTQYQVDAVCHLAAESHVDRSISGPKAFIDTNITGTFTLLDVARVIWGSRSDVLFHHVSTDEVFGSLGETGFFFETTPYSPRSPYSASKASSDHLVMAYYHTYNLPITLTNCSNNYGPYQYPEKLIPLMIMNILEDKPLPVYGDGKNIRDWLYVEDHNSAVWRVMTQGKLGNSYNIGGENEWENIKLLNYLIDIVSEETGKTVDSIKKLINYVKDRPGHDRRYAINCSKLKNELSWKQSVNFEQGLRKTVRWYLDNLSWISSVRMGKM